MSLHHKSDAEVLSSSVEDPEAFLLVFDRHFDRIAGYMARRASASEVEELASEVFLRAFASRRRFDRSRADVLPWLYGIATNVLRENRRRERHELELVARMEAVARGGSGTEATNADGPLAPRVAGALLSLSSKEREPLLLYALADLDYGQIAEALDVPLGTVKSRINQARNRLRRELGETGGMPPRLIEKGLGNG